MSHQDNWYIVEKTNIYTTGHLIIEENEFTGIINSQILNNDYKDKVIKKEYFTAKLKNNNKVSLLFFPIKSTGKILMEINISKSMVNQIESILPTEILNIIKGRERVKYTRGDI